MDASRLKIEESSCAIVPESFHSVKCDCQSALRQNLAPNSRGSFYAASYGARYMYKSKLLWSNAEYPCIIVVMHRVSLSTKICKAYL